MGALHDGHAALIKKSASENPITVVSVFVNPTQFGPNEDLTRYPRTLDADLERCQSVGATHVFVPDAGLIYPFGLNSAKLQIFGPTDHYEGKDRPGHFDGVCIVVLKLLQLVRPRIAYFGRKDLQQVATIQRLIAEFFLGIQLSIENTVRESDGLALSSRNRYLSERERAVAPQLYRALQECARELVSNPVANVPEVIAMARSKIDSAFKLAYFDLVDEESFLPQTTPTNKTSMVIAAHLGRTRLIDNIPIRSN